MASHSHFRIRIRCCWETALLALAIVVSCCLVAGAEPPALQPSAEKTPFFDRRKLPLEYAGPGREAPDPKDLTEVRIGYFGPDDPAHPEGGDLWCAAVLAIEEANQQGGYHGKPFRLVARWSDNPWTGGAAHVTQMVYTEGVWAILGGIDSASTHLAEQVATKARLPLICASNSDRTANSAIVPWIFSLLPGDQLQAPVLAAELARRIGRRPFVVIMGEDHDSRSFMAELNRSLAKNELAPQFQFVYRPTDADNANLAHRAIESQPAAVVLVANARGSARLVRDVRSAGFQSEIFGGPGMGRRHFLEEAGPAAEGVIFPLLVEPSEKWCALDEPFMKRFQRSPDFAAAGTYDAVQLLVAAVRKAGLNRARIGDALRELSPWDGAAGAVRWDTLGGNTRPVHLGLVSAGRLVRLDRPGGTP
jgi:branched-chain amino acid transport system substrate-binding protein